MLKSLPAIRGCIIGFFCAIFLLSLNYKAVGQGKLVAKPVSTVDSPYGYYEYLPKNYSSKSKHPMLIALHGIGEAGNSGSELSRVLKYGPAKLIKEGKWSASRPFVVIAPQSLGGFFNPTKLHDLIEHLKSTYRVDENRIYLTGLSAGGISIWNYLAKYQDQVAAVVPIAGKGQIVKDKGLCKLNKIPVWAFHGENDGTVNPNGSIIPVEFLRNCLGGSSSTSKVTIYPGVGHDAWSRTYDLSGMSSPTDGKYDAYSINIYDWLLKHTKGQKSASEEPPAPKKEKKDPKPVPSTDSDNGSSPVASASSASTGSCNCDYTITPQTESVDGKKLGVQGGDVVCIKAGFYRYLKLTNFVGAPGKPITIKNCGGKVTVGNGSWHYAIVITGSKHFRFTGTGSKSHEYGILIGGTRANSGLGIYDLSTDFEVDHIEVQKVPGAGMHILTRPTCDPRTWRSNFTMKNVSIHNNYLHDIEGEGMYIGHSGYPGKKINCDGKSKTVYPHSIQNIRVYNNVTKNTGWDGFQVSCADKDCSIYNNRVINFGTKKHPNQQAGIVLGGGTTGKLYNNYISNGTGGGIHIFGIGNIKAYNNVISNVGEDGIFIGDKTTRPGYSYELVNNTIVNPENEGLRLNTDDSKNNKYYNNLIVNPGSYGARSNKDRAFINNLKSVKNYTAKGNRFEKDISKVNFVDPNKSDYHLRSNSPAVDNGTSVSSLGIVEDCNGQPRAVGVTDIGAYECQKNRAPQPEPKPEPEPAVDGDNLNYKYYEGQWSTLPNFDQINPKKKGTIGNFTLSPRSTDENFGFVFSGYININKSGTYTFYTKSDDGSKLYIDDKTVVNNDNEHSARERSGNIYLSSGKHAIRVTFFENLGKEVLEVRYAGPGISKRVIPSDVLSTEGDKKKEPVPPSSVVQANAGSDRAVSISSQLVLNGRASGPHPFRGYKWTKVSGPGARLEDANTANLKLSNLKKGTYVFRFVATDNKGNFGSDETKLLVGNNARVATNDKDKKEVIIADEDYLMTVFPNPVRNTINITVDSKPGENLTLYLLDAIGRTLHQQKLLVQQENLRLNANQYISTPGVFYLVAEKQSGERNTLRLIKK